MPILHEIDTRKIINILPAQKAFSDFEPILFEIGYLVFFLIKLTLRGYI